MKYYTLHIDDSGAIEDIDERRVNGKTIPFCKMYDDPQFNALNDILHSTNEFILNSKALAIFQESNTIPFKIRNAKVLRKEKILGFLKKYKRYDYFELTFSDQDSESLYSWIDFEKSNIIATNDSQKILKIKSHKQKLDLIKENKSNSEKQYFFETKKIVFNENFNTDIDLFRIPFYSWGVYVSEKLRNELKSNNIKDIRFAESKEQLGKMWQPHFPIIDFNNKKR